MIIGADGLAVSDPNLGAVSGWAVSVMEALGSVGVALLVALENLFPPLPSEVILPLAGFTASQGSFSIAAVIAWATAGSLVGALALYSIGAVLGRERTRRLIGSLPLVKTEDVLRTEAWYERNGPMTVLVGRVIPIFRSLISIPAGVTRMRPWVFLGLTALGSLAWNTILIVAGYVLGENWHIVEECVGIFTRIVAGLLVA
ncbi:MAG: DedA family protein, partial [Actinomycetes bacterium]|nr:DedA family protein [Actinomycetes bacterium]MDX5398340.1 DedA family protein [Actinomycetes bacterium]MDX5449577.1 DedA family protein [Actinomycetes bacterium]